MTQIRKQIKPKLGEHPEDTIPLPERYPLEVPLVE